MTLDLPPNAGPDRDAAILQRITDQQYDPIRWATLLSDFNQHTAGFQVFADALMMDGVRINCSAEVQQKIADALDCLLLTPRLADLIWMQHENTLPPFPRGNPVGMSTTQAMIDHSAKIDAALAKFTAEPGLICTVGKHWVLDANFSKHPGMACNYGWHFQGQDWTGAFEQAVTRDPAGQPIKMIQGRGWRHDIHHTDYSQTCVLAARACVVDGEHTTLGEVLQSQELAGLASHQGVLILQRQPGVP